MCQCQNELVLYVRYELYQGMPLLTKSVLIESLNPSLTANLSITRLAVEALAVNVPYSPGSNADAINACSPFDEGPDSGSNMVAYSGGLYLQTDQAHGAGTLWSNDANTGNLWGSFNPNVRIEYLPQSQQRFWSVRLAPDLPGTLNGKLRSLRALELVLDIEYGRLSNLERGGLARRRMLSTLSPATTENPIFAATIESAPFTSNESLRSFIEQCNETMFELLIFSFGSGFNMETTDERIISYYGEMIEYANSRGIEIGGYDLIELDRTIGDGQYQQMDEDGKELGNVCFASKWYDSVTAYFDDFVNVGMSNIITDGPYGGGSCFSDKHLYHENANDSVFRQQVLQNEFFVALRNRNVYIHQPDDFYFYGGSKAGMGYNENQYSLPRWMDLQVSRMGMYDDTYIHLVTEGWMFLPLTAYHSNDPNCYFEPLHQNLADYDWALGQYFGFGVMAMMRGKELYDTEDTKQVVLKWTGFYRKHRQILISNIVHLRRCDMQSFDAILHANAFLEDERGLAVFYNPTNIAIAENYTFSLYYTGLRDHAMVSYNDGQYQQYALSNLFDLTLSLSLQPRSINFFVFKAVQ